MTVIQSARKRIRGNFDTGNSLSRRAVTKLGGNVELITASCLPNGGKVISDER
jgi:hypothetical protein